MNDVTSFERFLERLRDIGQEDLADALEACASNQEKWAAIGAHHVEVPHYDDLEATMIITAFEAGRLFEKDRAESEADAGGDTDDG